MTEQELTEQLAAQMHESWSCFADYILLNNEVNPDGSMTIAPGYVAELQKLVDTPYDKLNDIQKQSDREEVAQILPIINEYTAFSAQSCSNLVMAIAQLETRIDRIYNEVFKTEDAHVLDDRTRQTLLGRVNELSSMAALGDVSKPWS